MNRIYEPRVSWFEKDGGEIGMEQWKIIYESVV